MEISVWMLLGVGMGTVFCALLLIIGMGNLLIRFVNKYAPEDDEKKATPSASAIAPNIRMAIESAVSTITGGKGKVESIEKI